MSELDQLASGLWNEIVVGAVVFILTLFFDRRIKRFLIKAHDRLVNVPVSFSIVRIDQYDVPVESNVTPIFLHNIQQRLPEFEFQARSLTEKTLELSSARKNLELTVEISEQPEGGESELFDVRSTSQIAIHSPTVFGTNDLDALSDFSAASDGISNVLRNDIFRKESANSFVVCKIRRSSRFIWKAFLEKTDEDLQTKVRIYEDNLTLTLKQPAYLVRSVKKYLYA